MYINHIAVYSSDFSKTISFYKSIFPECAVKESGNSDDPLAICINQDFWIAVFAGDQNIFEHFAVEISVNQYLQIQDLCRSNKLSFMEEEHTFPYNAQSMYIQSPDGYEIEIFYKKKKK